MNNPAANRRTQSNQLNPNALPVSRKKIYVVAIGSAALILFSSISMWVMGKDLTVKSKQLNEVVGQLETINKQSAENQKIIEELKGKLENQEQNMLQLKNDNEQLKRDNDDLAKKYRERREALEKKRLLANFGTKVKLTNNDFEIIENTQPTGVFNASFYTPKCLGCSGSTASGNQAEPGVTIAVDTRYWKLGTKFYIEGFGVLIAQDTGGAIRGKSRVDICVSTTQEALKLGSKQLKFWVLD